MLDHIIVETGGVKIPLVRIALVSVIDPKTLSVNPYDPQVLFYLVLDFVICTVVGTKLALLLHMI